MANFKEVLFGSELSKTQDYELECYLNVRNEIFIRITSDNENFILLDKSTAIKFSKILRREINKIRTEVTNG